MNFSFVVSCVIILLLSILYINYSSQETWWHFDTSGNTQDNQKFIEAVTGYKEVDEFAVDENGEISSAYVIEVKIPKSPKKTKVKEISKSDMKDSKPPETKKEENKILNDKPGSNKPEKGKMNHKSIMDFLKGLEVDDTKIFDMEKEKELDPDDFSILEEQPPEKIKKVVSIKTTIQALGNVQVQKKSILKIKYENNTHWTDKLIS